MNLLAARSRLVPNLAAFLLSSFVFLLPTSASAMCPVCTVAVIGGVGLSRWLGVDDTVTGLWVGAALMSMSLWAINWLNGKKIKFFGQKILVFALVYVSVIWPLYTTNIIGHPINKIWGIDKLLLGMTLGSLIFIVFALVYLFMKKNNNGHAHFPFEKIVIVVVPLLIASGIFYIITK
jgi:hypothetical protein